MSNLLTDHDVLLLDLDGTVYLDRVPIPHAVSSLLSAISQGIRLAYVTNNASRTPGTVAEQLRFLGLPAREEEVITSSMAGATLVRERVGSGKVLAIGGEGVAWALREQGLVPVHALGDQVVAVMQGYGAEVTVRDLTEAAFAVRSGLPWIATNADLVLPTDRGLAPGNGSLVALVERVAGRPPDAIAGKPEPALIQEAIRRTGAHRPLIVGDRLDTDIAAGARLGIPSLLVLTGVSTEAQAIHAPDDQRATYLADDLRCLLPGACVRTLTAPPR